MGRQSKNFGDNEKNGAAVTRSMGDVHLWKPLTNTKNGKMPLLKYLSATTPFAK